MFSSGYVPLSSCSAAVRANRRASASADATSLAPARVFGWSSIDSRAPAPRLPSVSGQACLASAKLSIALSLQQSGLVRTGSGRTNPQATLCFGHRHGDWHTVANHVEDGRPLLGSLHQLAQLFGRG